MKCSPSLKYFHGHKPLCYSLGFMFASGGFLVAILIFSGYLAQPLTLLWIQAFLPLLSCKRDPCQALFPRLVKESLSTEKDLWFCSRWSRMASGSKGEQWWGGRLREQSRMEAPADLRRVWEASSAADVWKAGCVQAR